MKTLNIFVNFKSVMTLSLPLASLLADAQEVTTPKKRKIQLGVFVEAEKEFSKPNYFNNWQTSGLGGGLTIRYKLSNTFSIAAGLGISTMYSKYIERESVYYYDDDYETLYGYGTQYKLRLPLSLQANIYKQKFFVSAGLEFYNEMSSTYKITSFNKIRSEIEITNYKNGRQSLDVQLLTGLGWNFNALSGNAFSLETVLKMDIFYPTYLRKPGIYSPSVRLNWYFIK